MCLLTTTLHMATALTRGVLAGVATATHLPRVLARNVLAGVAAATHLLRMSTTTAVSCHNLLYSVRRKLWIHGHQLIALRGLLAFVLHITIVELDVAFSTQRDQISQVVLMEMLNTPLLVRLALMLKVMHFGPCLPTQLTPPQYFPCVEMASPHISVRCRLLIILAA